MPMPGPRELLLLICKTGSLGCLPEQRGEATVCGQHRVCDIGSSSFLSQNREVGGKQASLPLGGAMGSLICSFIASVLPSFINQFTQTLH